MRILRTIAELRRWRAGAGKVALVPTMGNLHAGHMALVKEAQRHGDAVVLSIFVNPTQFGPFEDFDRYPRTPKEDLDLCQASGVSVVFMPDMEEIYPKGRDGLAVAVIPERMTDVLCGAQRPGHFRGVTTVVSILFHLVRPDAAVFGEKDWQQLAILRAMVGDLHFGIVMVGLPTVREKDGLALSSRNRYLDEEARGLAPGLFKGLSAMQSAAKRGGRDVAALLAQGRETLRLAGLPEPEYLEIRSGGDLTLLGEENPWRDDARVFVAIKLGGARLIDNLPLLTK
ncbi:MAG: pantoate--beta-alanine ligase [Alphaproteobacteria bacterium CG_4_10_14_0_2_um_filter_63_37]|nr:MAG: pantoate--beta-alanine ligase [Proteobacteria bacterium CG1_02_64_396]PJA23800.1 MAG: pantoate--beta-alanine ligase [Alphaproteobacteria bacterium CG_4_10_14_0_2_um_filter_63_37]